MARIRRSHNECGVLSLIGFPRRASLKIRARNARLSFGARLAARRTLDSYRKTGLADRRRARGTPGGAGDRRTRWRAEGSPLGRAAQLRRPVATGREFRPGARSPSKDSSPGRAAFPCRPRGRARRHSLGRAARAGAGCPNRFRCGSRGIRRAGEPGRAGAGGNNNRARSTRARPPGSSDPSLQAGLNYGPLAMTSRGSEGRVFGDGLAAAAAAAKFASPEKLLVTADFARALQELHPARAAGLAVAGDFTDTRVRLHSFYTPDAKLGSVYRRRMLAYGVGGVAGILLLGVAGREAHQRLFPPLPAGIRLSVKPRGEGFVDGGSRGDAPPLQGVDVGAGRRRVQLA